MIRSTIIFAVISIFSHASAFEHKGKYDVSDLKPFLENFKTVMKTGNASFHIPVLDPHDVKDELYHVVLSFITADLHLKNLHMVGFSDYQVKEGRFELDTLDVVMDLHWDNINVRSDYDIDGVLGNRFLGNDKIYGNGKFTAVLKGLDVVINYHLGLKDDKTFISSISSVVSLDGLDVHATGIYNDELRSKEISKKISDMGPVVVRQHPKEAGVLMSEIAKRKLNLVIADRTLKELVTILGI